MLLYVYLLMFIYFQNFSVNRYKMAYYLILSQLTCSKKVVTTFTFCGPAERSSDIAV